MPTHLYCLLPTTSDLVAPDGIRAIEPGDGVVAWVADAASARLSRDARDAARATVDHDRIIGTALARGVTPVPALLADPYDDDASAITDLASRIDAIRNTLHQVSGMVEMTSIISIMDAAPAADSSGRGRAYLEQLRSGPHRAGVIADRIDRGLAGIAGEPRRRGDGGRVALSHLIARGAVAEYRNVVLQLAGDGYRLVVDGPRAPYSFAAYSPRRGFAMDQSATA
jgi:hypothetical protein